MNLIQDNEFFCVRSEIGVGVIKQATVCWAFEIDISCATLSGVRDLAGKRGLPNLTRPKQRYAIELIQPPSQEWENFSVQHLCKIDIVIQFCKDNWLTRREAVRGR